MKFFFTFLLTSVILAGAPWLFPQNQELIYIAVVTLIFFIHKRDNISTATIPYCAMFFPIQIGTGGADDVEFAELRVTQIVVYLLPIIVLFIYSQRYKFTDRKLPFDLILLIVFFSLLSLSRCLFLGTFLDLSKTLVFFVIYILYFQLSERDFDTSDFFLFNDVVFFILVVYCFLEFSGIAFPYLAFIPKVIDISSLRNARLNSLSCCPLIMVGYLCFYLFLLFTRILNAGKLLWIQLFLLLIVSILCMSRTIFIVEMVTFPVFFLYLIFVKKERGYFLNFIVFLLIAFAVVHFFIDEINLAFDRFDETDISLTSREVAYGVTWSHFVDYPFGEGIYYTSSITKYTTSKIALDNLFLDIISKFGLFSILWFYIICYPFKTVWVNIKTNKDGQFIFCMLILIVFLLSMSFVFLNYNVLSMLLITSLWVIDKLFGKKMIIM